MKIKILIGSLILISLIILIPASNSSRITVTYPPDTEELIIEPGEVEEVEVHLYNKNDNISLQANLNPSSLDNISMSFEDSILLRPNSMKKVFLEVSSEKELSFSGEVHVEFHESENEFSSKTGGKLVAGSSIPIGGKIISSPKKSSSKFDFSILLFVILALSLLGLLFIYRQKRKNRNSPLSRYISSSSIF